MEPEGSSPHSQAPATYPYPEPVQSIPHTRIPLLGNPSSLEVVSFRIIGCQIYHNIVKLSLYETSTQGNNHKTINIFNHNQHTWQLFLTLNSGHHRPWCMNSCTMSWWWPEFSVGTICHFKKLFVKCVFVMTENTDRHYGQICPEWDSFE
jgi:hypothetical protein